MLVGFVLLACWIPCAFGAGFEYGNSEDTSQKHVFHIKYNDQFHSGAVQTLVSAFKDETSIVFELSLTSCGGDRLSCDSIHMTHTAPEVVDRTCLVHAPMKPDRVVTAFNNSCADWVGFRRSRNQGMNEEQARRGLDCLVGFVNRQATTFRRADGQVSRAGRAYAAAVAEMYDSRTATAAEVKCDQVEASQLDTSEFIEKYWLRQRPLIIKNFHNVSGPLLAQLLQAEKGPLASQQVGMKLSPARAFEGIDDLLQWADSSSQYVPPEVLQQLTAPELVVVRAAHREMSLAQAVRLMRRNREANARAGDGWAEGVFAYLEYFNARRTALLPLLREMVALRCPAHEWFMQNTGLGRDKSSLGEGAAGPLALLDGTPHFWLSNGHTEGHLHFDAFDNLLLQIDGVKSFILVGPTPVDADSGGAPDWLAEGHMREAELQLQEEEEEEEGAVLDGAGGVSGAAEPRIRFRPKTRLSEATSMVHSPFHLEHQYSRPGPDESASGRSWREIHRRSSRLYRGLDPARRTARGPDVPVISGCDVFPGDAIWLPAYYWHEVISYPLDPEPTIPIDGQEPQEAAVDPTDTFNAALNLWFAPLYSKSFPCSECARTLNPAYHEAFAHHFSD